MIEPLLLIVGVVLFFCLLLTGTSLYQKYRLRERVQSEWGKIPKVTNFDKEESLKMAWKVYQKHQKSDSLVDDITWYDLDMITLFELLNGTKSSVGSEALYQRLRQYDFSEEELTQFQNLVNFFNQHDAEREKLQYLFATIGKRDKNFVADYLYEAKRNQLPNTNLYYGMSLLPILFLGITIFNPQIGLMGLVASLVVNVVTYFRKKQEIEKELISMTYLVSVIAATKKIGKIETPYQGKINQHYSKLKSIVRFGSALRVSDGSEAALFMEYFNMMFLLPIISYNYVLGRLNKYAKETQELWGIIGDLDAAIAILNFKKIMPFLSTPTFHQELAVKAEDAYHPLLSKPVANPVNWQQNTLVTGSNAAGKSTYVKTVALNAILAQTIGISCSKSISLPHGHILTSMAVEDDLFEGDSYFVAEIKSVKRIIQQIKKKQTCLCFIDEILRGTNTIERISASASIVNWMAPYQTLAFVATHDIELTEILKESCGNIHFRERVTETNGVEFDFIMREGPATTRNAIELLHVLDYPDEIVAQAKSEAAYFDKERKWRSIGTSEK